MCEFADPDYVVMMVSPDNTAACAVVGEALCALPRKAALTATAPTMALPQVKCSLREALFAPAEVLPLSQCLGRVVAAPTVSCPPAVPVLVGGEVVEESAIAVFRYYGYETLRVIK